LTEKNGEIVQNIPRALAGHSNGGRGIPPHFRGCSGGVGGIPVSSEKKAEMGQKSGDGTKKRRWDKKAEMAHILVQRNLIRDIQKAQ
jgi:hypothetical protein